MNQAEYRKMVVKYFKDYDIGLPSEMLSYYTPLEITKETSLYQCEYALKEGGLWVDSGLMISGKTYFIGDERVGYLINPEMLKICLSGGIYMPKDEEDRKSILLPRKEAIEYALFITYFNRKTLPNNARIVWGR